MRRKKILILPKLCDRKGDINKKWFVELSQRNPKTNEMVRFRTEKIDSVNINLFTTAAERYAFAEKIINELKSKLNNGWTIFNDTETFVYEDQTQYSHEARVYKRMVESDLMFLSSVLQDAHNCAALCHPRRMREKIRDIRPCLLLLLSRLFCPYVCRL
jgi:hypothetical protein